jgi:hypothetical protein
MSGATLEEIRSRPRGSRLFLADVLADEVERGRVRLDGDGRYELVRERFDANVLDALVTLQPADDDGSSAATRFRLDRPSTGQLARSS